MILAIITAILAYRRAKDNGRNPWIWALVGAAVFIGAQMIVTFGAGILMGLGVEFLGWSETVFDDTMVIGPVTIVALGASFLASWLLLRYLDKPLSPEPVTGPPPPPPPVFGSNH